MYVVKRDVDSTEDVLLLLLLLFIRPVSKTNTYK